MYSVIVSMLINGIFGICFTFSFYAIWFVLITNFVMEERFVFWFSVFNFIWIMLDVLYNRSRYQKQRYKSKMMFWTPIILLPILLAILMRIVMFIYF